MITIAMIDNIAKRITAGTPQSGDAP